MKKNRTKSTVNGKRWAAYAAAGAATAIGAPATVDAQITHVVVNQLLEDSTPGDGSFEYFQFSLEGVNALTFAHSFDSTSQNCGKFLALWSSTTNTPAIGDFAGTRPNSSLNYASNVPYGQFVSALTAFTDHIIAAYMAWCPPYSNSQFNDPGTSYMAFSFDVGNGTQFGWARLDMEGNGKNRATLVEYAYGDPGQSIFVGQVPNKVAVTSDAITVSLGSIGAGGLPELAASDDQYLVLDPEFLTFRYQLEYTVDGTSPTDTPIGLEFNYESKAANFVGTVEQKIELFNYVSGSFEQIDSGLTTSTDTVVSVIPTGDPTRFVQAGSGAMQARVYYQNSFPFWVFSTKNLYLPYRVRADHLFWSITE